MRLPSGTDADALEAQLSDPTGVKSVWDRAQAAKLELLCAFFVGEMVTCLRKASLAAIGVGVASAGVAGGDCILYTTMAGSIGVLIPLRSRDVCTHASSLSVHSIHSIHSSVSPIHTQ